MNSNEIDLSSLETKKKENSIIYTNIYEKYGIDLFKKGNNTKQKIDDSGLFLNKNSESELNIDKLFSSTESKSINSTSSKQEQTDYFSIIGIIFLLVIFVVIIWRFVKNEKSH